MQAIAQFKKWFADPVESVFAQVPRALVASGLAALVDVGVLMALVELCDWHPAPASVVAYLIGGVLQYVLCSIWVFPNAPRSVASGFAAFTVLSLVGLLITWATIAALFDWGRLHYGFAKVVALGFAFAWNFLSRKYLLFKNDADPETARPEPDRRAVLLVESLNRDALGEEIETC
ncbi:MAG: GtrA family protein [Gemmataceae bacterium]